MCHHTCEHVTTTALAELLDAYGGENVMFLAKSVLNLRSPIRVHVNLLAKVGTRL
jgi:hypothetical protein